MNWIQRLAVRLLKIEPARDRTVVIREPLSFEANVIKNQIWYRGDSQELSQYFKHMALDDVSKARFWASVTRNLVRKSHSGIVQIVVDRFADIVNADLDDFSFNEVDAEGNELEDQPIKELWNEIAEANKFNDILHEAVTGALSSADGAFKISIDGEISNKPIIEFYSADNVEFEYKRRSLVEIKFYTSYFLKNKEYRLQEAYGKGYVRYKLLDDRGKEQDLRLLPETQDLEDVTFQGDFIMAVPLIFFTSSKWKGRGKALFDSKTDSLDGLDEIISQWLDSVRMGRVKRYIPNDMIPRNPETGEPLIVPSFDDNFVAVENNSMAENYNSKIEVVQPNISYDAYANSYSCFLDLCLQGIMSPSTLGIDLKKTDNAESQREKEKITIYTRNKLIDVLSEVLPRLAEVTLMTYDLMQNRTPGEYEATVQFGEYSSPTFDEIVDVVGKAKTYGVMSLEKAIDELYGDTMTDDEKAVEVERIKKEEGIGLEPETAFEDIEEGKEYEEIRNNTNERETK